MKTEDLQIEVAGMAAPPRRRFVTERADRTEARA